MALLSVGIFVLGLLVGSFLNVCIFRIPKEQSIVFPRSYCPHCHRQIPWYDNIPVISFLVLGARCRHCAKRISWRYPAVEVLSAFLLWGLWRRWGTDSFWFFPAYVAAAVFVIVAFIDWDTFLIPDVLSYGLLILGLVVAPWNPILGEGVAQRLGWSLVGALGGFLMCWGTAVLGEWIFKKEAMGGGDVKLMAAIGAWGGVLGAFDCLLVASFFGAIYGIGLMVTGKIKRQDPIPFGPFLSAGAVFNFFYLLPLGFPFLTS